MESLYFTFQSDMPINERLVNHNYFNEVVEKIGFEKADEFIKENPLFYNSKLNRYQNFKIN